MRIGGDLENEIGRLLSPRAQLKQYSDKTRRWQARPPLFTPFYSFPTDSVQQT
jgi:hypothetical protein